jgi:hypothetical protein
MIEKRWMRIKLRGRRGIVKWSRVQVLRQSFLVALPLRKQTYNYTGNLHMQELR